MIFGRPNSDIAVMAPRSSRAEQGGAAEAGRGIGAVARSSREDCGVAGGRMRHEPQDQGVYQMGEVQARSWMTFGTPRLSQPRASRSSDGSDRHTWVLHRHVGFSITRA